MRPSFQCSFGSEVLARTSRRAPSQSKEEIRLPNSLPNSEPNTSVEGIAQPDSDFNRRMGNIWLELLKKAAMFAAAIGLIAGLAVALFFRS